MARYTHKDENGRYYIESKNGLLESDIKGRVYGEAIDRFAELENTPTADVAEVKYGYWEIVKGSNGKEKMVCTNCRHQQDLHSTFTYCPNCGALIGGRVIYND